MNRPINHNDPTGHRACSSDDECKEMGITASGKTYLDLKGYSTWEKRILRKLYDEGGDDAEDAVNYILSKKIHIKVGVPFEITDPVYPTGPSFKGDWQTMGDVSGWYTSDSVVLNPNKNNYNQMPDSWHLATIVHETLHIQQGFEAFTKDGELEGYQVSVRVFMALEKKSFSELDTSMQDLYNSSSGWDYGQKWKQSKSGYWNGLRLLPPYRAPYPGP